MSEPIVVDNPFRYLEGGLKDKTASIGIIGLGYVGLPLAVEYARKGFETIGIDLKHDRVDSLNGGESYIEDISSESLKSVLQTEKFSASSDLSLMSSADVLFICVPTPVNTHKAPDISSIISASKAVARTLRPGQLVVLKSTTFPDTTEGVVLPILQKAAEDQGMKLGEDYFLAFSPERIDPGNKTFTTATTPVVVGGVTAECTKLAALAMEQIVDHVHTVSSPRVAELEKLLENIFRSVNIALVNEMARLCDRMGGISIWEVVEAAATKPFGFMPFYPGPGLGGHCIPIDPYYLSWLARKYDFETSFITLSAQTNEGMPFYVVDAILKGIAKQPVRLAEAKVLILGAAFKKDVDDIRHSPALRVIEILSEKGVRNISYSDPHVPTLLIANNGEMSELQSEPLTPELIESQDVVVILTDHSDYDYEMIANKARLIVDTRNAMKVIPVSPEKMMLLGGGDF